MAIKSKSFITPGEQQILDLLPFDLTSQEIADQLGTTKNSVNVRFYQLYRKTGCKKRTHLLNWAQENQLIASSPPDIDPKYFRIPASNYIGRRIDINQLTETEKKVLNLLGKGLSNQEIANNLIVERRTVESHVHNLLTKTGQDNRVALAMWALSRGEIQLPQDTKDKQLFQPTLEEGQLCQVRLYKNSSSVLSLYNGTLVTVAHCSDRGVLCTNLKGEFIKDIFYYRELLPIDETKPINQEVELPLDTIKQLANYGVSINEAIANLLLEKCS